VNVGSNAREHRPPALAADRRIGCDNFVAYRAVFEDAVNVWCICLTEKRRALCRLRTA
jgi:hypothetical protein